DGIRDKLVTGVQTCALPISFGGATGWVDKLIGGWQWNGIFVANSGFPITPQVGSNRSGTGDTGRLPDRPSLNPDFKGNPILGVEIGRASCRERGWMTVGTGM